MKTLLSTSTALALCAAPAVAASDMAASDHSVGGICYQGYAEIDSDGDGKLTRDEVARTTKAAFPKLDSDGDGTISQAEYTDCLNASAGMMSMESDRNAENMAQYDTDGDGTLTQAEFMAAGQDAAARGGTADADEASITRLMFVPSKPASTPSYTTWDREDMAASNYVLFVSLDSDESGDLSGEEWSQRQATRKDMIDELTAQFEAADKDGSGDLTEDELVEMRTGKAELATRTAEADTDDGHRQPPVVYYRYDSTM